MIALGTFVAAIDIIILSDEPGTFTSSENTLYSNLFPLGNVLYKMKYKIKISIHLKQILKKISHMKKYKFQPINKNSIYQQLSLLQCKKTNFI